MCLDILWPFEKTFTIKVFSFKQSLMFSNTTLSQKLLIILHKKKQILWEDKLIFNCS